MSSNVLNIRTKLKMKSLEKAGCFRQIFLVIVYFIDKDMYPTKDICDVLKIKVGTNLNMCKQVKRLS